MEKSDAERLQELWRWIQERWEPYLMLHGKVPAFGTRDTPLWENDCIVIQEDQIHLPVIVQSKDGAEWACRHIKRKVLA